VSISGYTLSHSFNKMSSRFPLYVISHGPINQVHARKIRCHSNFFRDFFRSMATRILVASIGNPAPYTNTFHSAGHVLSDALLDLLGYPRFTSSKSPAGRISKGPDYTFYQSPSSMNVSGKPVVAAWKSFLRDLDPDERATAKLVVLHDELELGLGKIKKKVGGSARGHNGIKDIAKALGNQDFIRIGTGIGRPVSRESSDVANYVLKKMTPVELTKVKDSAQEVVLLLERIRDGG